MFYSQFILAKKGPLGTIWIAAHLERKLRKNQVADTDIGVSVDSIIFPDVPIALRLSSHLMLGVVRIYSRKVNYLFHDCSEALLKIKQAFRSTAVDLPPEESTAPYHSITLPETFDLDDFELPEAAFQGDTDHHVSTKEQITLQDNPEKTGYSTSQFGLDERFGDGSSSHIGLDLEEELILNKDHSIHLESDDGIIIQGRPSVPSTDMDIDDNKSTDITAEGYSNMDGGPSSHGKLGPLNADDLGGNSIPNWTGYNAQTPYNVQTPDLNDILLHNEGIAGPSASYYQPSPFTCDEPASPEFISAQAPATPGLMGETVPSRVHESPVLSPQRKASPSTNDETARADTPAPASDFLHSATGNASDVVGAEMTELELAKPVQVESSVVQDTHALVQQHTSEGLPSQGQASHLEATADKLVGSDGIAASVETVTVNATIEDVPLAVNDSERCVDGSTEPSVVVNPVHINGPLIDAQGTIAPSADFQHEAQAMQQVVASNDRLNELSTSEFAEPEKMLSAPDAEFNHAIDLGQTTAEKGTAESDGSNIIGSLTSRKRHLEDSLPALESETTERLSSRPLGKRTNDFVPHDDDILASILVGRRTPGFTLDSTPLPPRESSLKRPRLGSKMGTLKRKVQIDDAMVLHADTIRQQLINTEDIRRIRKKAPCTRSEIWMIEKGLSEELNKLHNRTYEAIVRPGVQSMELQGQFDMPETIPEDSNIAGFGAATINDPLHIPDGIQSDALLSGANVACGATPAFGLQIPPDNQVNGASNDFVIGTLFQGVTEPFIDNEKEVALADREHAQVDTLYSGRLQDVPSDLQRSTDANVSSQDVALDNSGQAYAHTGDDMTREFNHFVHSNANIFESNEVPASEITGVEYNQDASGFPRPTEDKNAVGYNQDASGFPQPTENENAVEYNQDSSGFPRPTEDENAVSAMGDNSGFQENNMGSLMDLDMVNDYELKECNDFGSAIHGVDTDFLNYDDDGDFDDANDDEPNPSEFQSLDNSGWSSRTRGVARYLKTLFDEDSGLGRKSVAIDHLVRGKTRKEASRMFFETLVLTTKDYISVDQPNPYDFVSIKPGPKLLMSEF
ncbi:unnamed protein product [Miscanthus lutarioriparius]|uniref:Sister chromatid cohesion 1 protein 4 n=1 Tax=Miscanthus lutarioriparius TaxID=422564 RepID=A0A811NWK0_9POAL|nr:unnamed protein product [Miscanthus lutarioriparius]